MIVVKVQAVDHLDGMEQFIDLAIITASGII